MKRMLNNSNHQRNANQNHNEILPLICQNAAAAKSLQSCPTLCDPTDGSPPGSSVPGILQARILQWVAISFSNACMHAKLLQSCLTLCNTMDSSPPGSSVHRILQARTLEWVAISFSELFPNIHVKKKKIKIFMQAVRGITAVQRKISMGQEVVFD